MTIPPMNISDFLAFAALILSAWSLYQNYRFNKRQSKFEETNVKLTQILIEKETDEIVSQKKADLSVNFIKIGNNRKLKVFNRGKSAAKNVRLEIMDNSEVIAQWEINRKFPIPILEQHEHVDLLASAHQGSPSRIHIKLIWDDEYGTGIEKELHPSL